MKYKLLDRVHPDVDLKVLRTYQDLFEGGATFRARVQEYLPRNEMEPLAVYRKRCERAPYINYAASIANFFASALFTCPPTITSDPESVDAFYAELKEDADGSGTDLDAMLRDMVVRALVGRRAYLRVEFPEPGDEAPATLADEDRAGLRRARLVPVPTHTVRNWRRDASGAFAWVLTHEHRTELVDLDDEGETLTEVWTQWYADGTARRWSVARNASDKLRPDDDVPEVDAPHNPCGAIPLVELALPAELWLLNHLSDPALEMFRKRAAQSWAIERSAYTMPWFFLKDAKKPPTMGTGYWGQLGVDERVEWPGPNAVPFEVLGSVIRELVQELHRVAQQMALGVDNNGTALGRSGDSKKADHEATEIVLKAYGQRMREPVERALDLIARGRGEKVVWSVGGMDVYDLADAKTLTEIVSGADGLKIPSATYRREALKAVAHAVLPHVDEETRQKIDREIEVGVPDAEEERESTVPPPPDGDGELPEIPKAPRVPKDLA